MTELFWYVFFLLQRKPSDCADHKPFLSKKANQKILIYFNLQFFGMFRPHLVVCV